ncbi:MULTISPECIES: dienelactone hydrolase family protein [Micromonospora]|uniref:Carboxymethylenebutenolidase n=1 Tax=Micromonospora yangpuensis TaxID=683228 RepID=A0A1C6U6W9_9ACTN|nr:dienelactone hydrolase family protein [Micromonospora yangpuensis]GGL90586.1 carboxymethylenebutenolidase [Micromonospora yangpuensis]SCL49734.1 carboxymethylenebutenolidase [Micromonospora yangpuensis]
MGEMVTYRDNGGTSQGYLAVPATGTTSPAVIVIQEWWGLVPHITSVVDRYAEAGFVALAPDLYRGESADEPDEARRLMMALRMDDAAKDIAGAADYLAGRPEVAGKVGAVGFCAGGSLALWSATLSERIVATAGFYPVLPWEKMSPDWADYAGKSAIIHCAEADGTSSADGVQTARAAIEAAGGTCQTYDYPGTAHAFFNDDRPESFDQPAAASAWARTLELFRAKLG